MTIQPRVWKNLEGCKLRSVRGTVQRVDYRKKRLRLVAEGRVWEFTLDCESQLRFDDEWAVLRCFHPLDQVVIVFVEGSSINVIRALYGWEKQFTWAAP